MIATYLRAFQIGLISGMRAMSGPALLSHKLTQLTLSSHQDKALHYAAQPQAALTLKVLAGGEMIADKLPNAPNRTSPPQFIARIASGATCGGLLSDLEGRFVPFGAVAGGLGAVASTLLFFNLRRWLDHDLGLPDAVGALTEDALVIGGGLALINAIQPAVRPA